MTCHEIQGHLATRLLTSGQAAFGCSMWRALLTSSSEVYQKSAVALRESEKFQVRRFSRTSWEAGDDVDLDSVAYGFMASQAAVICFVLMVSKCLSKCLKVSQCVRPETFQRLCSLAWKLECLTRRGTWNTGLLGHRTLLAGSIDML